MTDVAKNSNKIQEEQITVRRPVSQSLNKSYGGALNYVIDLIIPIGTFVPSMLTETQMNIEIGSSSIFVLADGRDVTGSRYQTVTGNSTVPDVRGEFLRAKNNGRADGKENPGGDLTLGSYQSDFINRHNHEWYRSHYPDISGFGSTYDINSSIVPVTYGILATKHIVAGDTDTATRALGADDLYKIFYTSEEKKTHASDETRSRNITCNYFIRIN